MAGEWDLLPVPLNKSRSKEDIGMNTRELTLAAVFAALYATMVIIFAPISFGPVQLRLADALIPFSAVFGVPVIIGVSLGTLVGNFYWFLSPIDIILGSIANLISSYIIYKYKDNLIVASVVGSFIIGSIVGGYLWLFFPPPNVLSQYLPVWLAMIVSITLSSLIAISILGVGLVKTLIKTGYLKQFNDNFT
ncbi:hypothetical protein GF319_13595 [Candidatus Bathyarchaeota archaeon]|nr:hypothetical protein [Candidatus Bathyarchaeota archaeon]